MRQLSFFKRINMKLRRAAAVFTVAALTALLAVPAVMAEEEKKYPEKPSTDAAMISKWDCIYFGSYPQRDTNEDGVIDEEDMVESIKWRVLDVQGDNALIITDKNIDRISYNTKRIEVTWSNSTLRSYLNGYDRKKNVSRIDYVSANFISTAFNEEEREAIVTSLDGIQKSEDIKTDAVFILSNEDLNNADYGFINFTDIKNPSYDILSKNALRSRLSSNTDYAIKRGVYNYTSDQGDDYGMYWMRDTGKDEDYAQYVNQNGKIITNGTYVHSTDIGLRPALWLDLSKNVWGYAGCIYSDEGTGQESDTKEGKCGDEADYVLKGNDEEGYSLTISGNGAITSYESEEKVPWFSCRDKVKSVVINGNIQASGMNAFAQMSGLNELTMPITMQITEGDFTGIAALNKLNLMAGKGEAADYDGYTYECTPWYQSKDNTILLTISDEVTGVGDYTFFNCKGLSEESVIPESVAVIGTNAFTGTPFEQSHPANEKIPVVVYFFVGDGDIEQGSIELIFGLPYGELPTPTLSGYKFVGWFTDDGTKIEKDTLISIRKDHTITAEWEESDDPPGASPTPNPGKDDSSSSSSQGKDDSSSSMAEPEKKDDTLSFSLNGTDAEITFNLNGGEMEGDYYTLSKDGKKALFVPPTRVGYTFRGWYFGGQKVMYLNASKLKKYDDRTLKAMWNENKYTLKYKLLQPPTGERVKGKAPAKKLRYTQYFRLNDTVNAKGYRLAGWSLVPNSKTVKYLPGKTVSMLAGDVASNNRVVLYPVWAKVEE